MVFTEFMDMVEERLGIDVVDDLIDSCELESEGAYTSVGNYSPGEIVALVSALSAKTGIAVPQLIQDFGTYLLNSFSRKMPDFFKEVSDSFAFMETVDRHIHIEVKKLYDSADLPSVVVVSRTPNTLAVRYESACAMGDLAVGLMRGVFDFYGENIELSRKALPPGDGTVEEFTLTRVA